LKAERAWFLARRARRAKPETEQLLLDLWLATNLGEPRGCVPSVAGRFETPEKGRQGAPIESGRPSEGGKRSCSPSEDSLGQKLRVLEPTGLSTPFHTAFFDEDLNQVTKDCAISHKLNLINSLKKKTPIFQQAFSQE